MTGDRLLPERRGGEGTDEAASSPPPDPLLLSATPNPFAVRVRVRVQRSAFASSLRASQHWQVISCTQLPATGIAW